MCLHPSEISPVPEETARVAVAAFPKGNMYMRLRDELGIFFQDEDFASVYPQRGQSAQAPWRLAMVLIMQFLENLSDRQAASSVRSRIDWKYALSLELTDPGFDFSVLSEFRDRLISGGVEQQILDKMLSRFQELKLLSARGKQRTDSTHVLSVVRELSRLENLGETLRYALNAVAEVDPTWLKLLASPEWYDRYSKRFEDYRLPKTTPEREALAILIGADGFRLLDEKTAYCPQGKCSSRWKKTQDTYGNPVIRVDFRSSDCSVCPVRSHCTRSKTKPRGLTLQMQSDYEVLQKARERQKTEQFQQQYALRSGIEGTISQGIRAFELRHCRYVGLAKSHLQHILTAAAMNLVRVFAWWEEMPLAKTRKSHLAKLADPILA